MKLSKELIQKYKTYLLHFGDEFGISPRMSVSAEFLWTDNLFLEDDFKPVIVPYALFMDGEYYYYALRTTIYKCKRSVLHSSQMGFVDFACMFYLVFANNNTIEL